MPATILDVVALCGYSRATVTRAFAEPDLVKASTRDKVFQAAKELNYTPSAIAQAMVKKRTGNIGFILSEKQYPVILNPFYAPIVDSVLESCAELNLSLFISSTRDLRLTNGDIYLKRQLDGAILAGEISEDIVEYLRNQNIPFVLLNSYREEEETVSIIANHYKGALTGLEYLISKGHKKIALIQGSFSAYIMNQTQNAYRDSMKAGGFECREYIINAEYNESIDCVNKILKNKKEIPTAFFCANDTIAIGTIKAILRAGYQIPGDLAVLGYDDSVLATAIEPELTTIHVPKREMGKAAAFALQKLINGEEIKEKVIEVKTHLVKRNSV